MWNFLEKEFPKCTTLKMDNSDLTLEVQQQLGDGIVRTIALGSSDGLKRGMVIKNTGAPITVLLDKQHSGELWMF